MQPQLDLFGVKLPETLQHMHNYRLQHYYLGKIMSGQAFVDESLLDVNSDLPVDLKEAEEGTALVQMVYHGIHNLDLNPDAQVPHEMLLFMNASQILQVYAGGWLLKMNASRWNKAASRRNLWQVVGAARRIVSENHPMRRRLLSRLDELCGVTYSADVDGDLPARLRQLPQSMAAQFMGAFTHSLIGPGTTPGYLPLSMLNKRLEVVVCEHFEARFAEGERQLGLGAT